MDLGLGFDHVVVPGDTVPGAVNDGTAALTATVVTAGRGRLSWVPGPGGGSAVRTPAHAPTGPVPAAAIVIWPDPGVPDPFNPGTRDVVLGLDFRADRPAPGRPEDDGDNLLQRGRFGERAQVKIQLDHGIPSCRMAGSLAEVVVAAKRPVSADRWYRLTCSRTGASVRLRLVDLEGIAPPQDWETTTDPGDITFTRVPLSIGAKVADSGRIDPRSVDQFHGMIDSVYFDVR